MTIFEISECDVLRQRRLEVRDGIIVTQKELVVARLELFSLRDQIYAAQAAMLENNCGEGGQSDICAKLHERIKALRDLMAKKKIEVAEIRKRWDALIAERTEIIRRLEMLGC